MVNKDARTIQAMFAAIAPRYDLTNRILSVRFDVFWRRHVARHLIDHPGTVLDLAAGTGDLTLALERLAHHRVVAADFTYEMLLAGMPKLRRHRSTARPIAADALYLPFRDSRFDAATVAFGVRNFADPIAGLSEIHRILRPGGVLGVLEFSRPTGVFGLFFDRYFENLLPAIGGAVTGSRRSYEYLTTSVVEFPEGEAFLALMGEAGFRTMSARRLTGGVATYYRGVKL